MNILDSNYQELLQKWEKTQQILQNIKYINFKNNNSETKEDVNKAQIEYDNVKLQVDEWNSKFESLPKNKNEICFKCGFKYYQEPWSTNGTGYRVIKCENCGQNPIR